jgi:diguanylate cyclase (GGDEF)-like protein
MPDKINPQSILIIDDDSNIRDLLTVLLMDQAEVVTAADGATGLSMARDTNPDLIILDIQMPGMDGYEVCIQLKSESDLANIPVVFLTAQNDVKNEKRGLEVGAIDYIRKPFSHDVVQARIRNHLKMQWMNNELERLASTDPLTGAFNRRYFFSAARSEVYRSNRYGHSLSLMMLDIDHFKSVNDNYGHDAGDKALKITVETILRALRNEDVLARFGGEEFIVMLPETDGIGSAVNAGIKTHHSPEQKYTTLTV